MVLGGSGFDCCHQVPSSSSSMRLMGWSAMRCNISCRFASGSRPFSWPCQSGCRSRRPARRRNLILRTNSSSLHQLSAHGVKRRSTVALDRMSCLAMSLLLLAQLFARHESFSFLTAFLAPAWCSEQENNQAQYRKPVRANASVPTLQLR